MDANAIVVRPGQTLLFSAAAGCLIILLLHESFALTVGAVIFFSLFAFALRQPQAGVLIFLFSIYSNVGVLAMKSQTAIQAATGTPDTNPRIIIVLAAMSLLLVVSLAHQIFSLNGKLIFDHAFVLMLAFFTVSLASSFFGRDEKVVQSQLFDYFFEGLVLYWLLINAIRDAATLRQATWALLLAGTLMASVSILQRVTHTEDHLYGGLAQIVSDPGFGPGGWEGRVLGAADSLARSGENVGQVRSAGPIGESNRYAQVLLVLLPLAVLRFRTERSRLLRRLALLAGGIVLRGLLLTFSRECLLAAVIVFGLMAYMRMLRLRHVLVFAMSAALLIAIFEPGIAARMATLERLGSLASGTHASDLAPDSSSVRRYVLNVAAWHVFLEHPLLGVGPGQFAAHYSAVYANRVGIIESRLNYRAHNLYMETLAETGFIGLAAFLSIVLVILVRLWRECARLKESHPELAQTAAAFFLSLTAFAITAIFAHLSYQRYFWLLLALSSAAVRIVNRYSQDSDRAEIGDLCCES